MAVWSAVKLSMLTPDFRLDSEYYRPELLALDRTLERMNARRLGDLGGNFIVGPFGSDFNVENYVEESSFRYVRGKDVKPFFLQDDDSAYMPKAHFDKLSKYALKPFDLLISVVGTLGNCAIVPETIGKAIFSCKSTVWRPPNREDEYALYLATYLNCRIGQALIQRMPRGHIQTGLNLEDLRSIPVVEPDSGNLKRIAAMVRKSQSQITNAKGMITAAEAVMMKALGLDHLDLTSQKCYSRCFRELQAGNRFGAEYYMPCKKRVLDALAGLPHRTIADYAPSMREMWDPTRARKGDKVRNFDVTDALAFFLDDAEPQIADEIGSTKKRFQAGDVVISRLRSYLKEIAVVRTSDSLLTVGSSEFIVLRPTADGLSAETLMVFLRCPLVQTILKWSQDGSNHPRFATEDLLAIPVPDAVFRVQQKIDVLVKDAIEARRESARLLNQAKKTVEDMVAKKRP